MKAHEMKLLEEIRRVAEHQAKMAVNMGRLEEKVSGLEERFSVFIRDHNDLVSLKTQWRFLAGLAAFCGSAFVTLFVYYIKAIKPLSF